MSKSVSHMLFCSSEGEGRVVTSVGRGSHACSRWYAVVLGILPFRAHRGSPTCSICLFIHLFTAEFHLQFMCQTLMLAGREIKIA